MSSFDINEKNSDNDKKTMKKQYNVVINDSDDNINKLNENNTKNNDDDDVSSSSSSISEDKEKISSDHSDVDSDTEGVILPDSKKFLSKDMIDDSARDTYDGNYSNDNNLKSAYSDSANDPQKKSVFSCLGGNSNKNTAGNAHPKVNESYSCGIL